MSDLKASVVETKNGFHVEGYEKIEYDFSFLDGGVVALLSWI
jgi:3-dehydroquinate synthase